MKRHEFHFKTLTPLWTGDLGRNSNHTQMTGVLGSLRWWYEGIVRGLGGNACNITGDDASRCRFKREEKEHFEQAYARLCLACRLFGCTGWQRRFRLDIEGLNPQPLFFVASRGVYPTAGNWLWRIFGGEDSGEKEGRGAAVTFRFDEIQVLWGKAAAMRVTPLVIDGNDVVSRLAFLLDIMVRWGALGAKPQHGFGHIQITNGLDTDLVREGKKLVCDEIKIDKKHKRQEEPAITTLFNLNHFFSHLYQSQVGQPPLASYLKGLRKIGESPQEFNQRESWPFVPCAFDIRYKSRMKGFHRGEGEDFGMRPWFRKKWGKEASQVLFGRSDAPSDDRRSAGRIHVSHLWREDDMWCLKVWGHVPPNLKNDKKQAITVEDVSEQVEAFVCEMFGGQSAFKLIKQFDSIGGSR